MKDTVYIDGSLGEGGGQVLRTSLALSMITGKSFEIKNIRAKRKKPGLLRQHLTCVKAAAEISSAEIQGAELGSLNLWFTPGKVKSGEYTFKVGSAGSAMLVFQTVLPVLMLKEEESVIHLEGGTHNPMAPPYHFIEESFAPLLKKMAVNISGELKRWGFYPAGGGQVTFKVSGRQNLLPLTLLERGEEVSKSAKAYSANLTPEITEAEASYIKSKLDWSDISTESQCHSVGPGNVIMAQKKYENITELFCEFGEKGVRAPKVAQKLVSKIKKYISSSAPVGEYLADQLLLPMALAKSGSFCCTGLSLHTKTNIQVIKSFLNVNFLLKESQNNWIVSVE
ncbi:MAG: RNA 3'-terminal phosphate cyclase [Lentisphaerales bacterium]|nr:RNA 3'-terminal phosphate cyclase [Lentisphaerales bacterium]